MILYELMFTPVGVYGLYSSNEMQKSFHITAWTAEGAFCSCSGYNFKKTCKHTQHFIEYVLEHNLNKEDFDMNKYSIPSQLTYMNKLFGGIPRGALFGQFAEFNTGKTISSIHYIYDVLSFMDLMENKKTNALVMDTEGSLATHVLPVWIPILNKRYSLNVGVEFWTFNYADWENTWSSKKTISFEKEVIIESDDYKIIVIDTDSLQKLHLLHGRPINIQISDKGKTTVVPTPKWNYYDELEKVPLQRIIKQEKISVMVMDSFSQLLIPHFIGGTANYPSRNDSAMGILTKAQELTRKNFIVSIMNFHASKDPTKSGSDIKHIGGKSIGHNFKFMLFHGESAIDSRHENASKRVAKVIRSPKKLANPNIHYLITDEGIIDNA